MKSKGKGKKEVEERPRFFQQVTAIDFLKVTRELFGMSLVETKLLYDYLLEQSKRRRVAEHNEIKGGGE